MLGKSFNERVVDHKLRLEDMGMLDDEEEDEEDEEDEEEEEYEEDEEGEEVDMEIGEHMWGGAQDRQDDVFGEDEDDPDTEENTP